MKIATQHYQDSVITPYGNNHWNGKEKIDISKEKDDEAEPEDSKFCDVG